MYRDETADRDTPDPVPLERPARGGIPLTWAAFGVLEAVCFVALGTAVLVAAL